MDCLFCKISNKEIPAQIIHEDDHSSAFLDINPCSPGHTVVIPKFHTSNLIDLPEDKVSPLFLTVKRITGILSESLNPQGFTIGINHGKKAGQAIDHLHIHIIPRYKEDDGGSIHTVVQYSSNKSVGEIFEIIKEKNDKS